ncbi:long-chain-fatty-acid--CoA ligase ACSBG2-like [Dysidea avara]|uniref:long-chain-fatty-acid--CoA ligase ACSBG2-like n=1 Tax=Dysidea avara TaxID=196820 RepID=UPI00332787CB
MFLRYADYKKLVYDVAKSFHKLGLESHHGVGILGFNSVEWFASSLGAVFAGGLSTGMYTTSSPETCHYILENCKANIVVVENKEQLDKILEIRHMLTHLKAIIQYKGELSKRYPKTYTWKEFLEVGKDTEDSVIDDIIDKQQPNQCAVLVYTSGTTGNPKGVMLSHDNLTWITKALMDTQQEPKLTCGGQERSVSYLPLAHIAGMIADIYLPILIGSTVYIAQPDALKEKDSLRHTMKEAIPTFFLGVPRLWERMKEMIDEHVANSNNAIVKYFFRWGTKENHSQSGWKYAVAKITVFKQFQKKAGLHMCKHIFVGSAPMHQATFEFFKSLNISISELYGLTECSGLHSIKFKSATQSKPKSCGKQLNGVETNIIECGVDEHNRGEGQVLIRGRHVFIGYLGMEKETREAIDDDGWLHSGDIGYRDDDNFLYITGRIKELISFPIINPNPIEDRIKTEIPFLSNVVVIGDNREFLTCLLTLKCTTNNNGEATDDLQSKVIKMFKKKLGSHCEKASEVYDTKDKAVFQAIGEGIRRYNMASRAHQVIRKFQLLRTDFTTRGGELGPTLKIQRQAIQKKYEKLINAMYT